MVVVPYPHAGATSARTRASWSRPARRAVIEDEAFDAAALLDAARLLEDAHAHLGDVRPRPAALGRPGAADAVAELVLALAERRPLPDADTIERLSRAAAA